MSINCSQYAKVISIWWQLQDGKTLSLGPSSSSPSISSSPMLVSLHFWAISYCSTAESLCLIFNFNYCHNSYQVKTQLFVSVKLSHKSTEVIAQYDTVWVWCENIMRNPGQSVLSCTISTKINVLLKSISFFPVYLPGNLQRNNKYLLRLYLGARESFQPTLCC